MKKFIISIVSVLVLLSVLSFSNIQEKQKVSIVVSNIKKPKGTIYVSVFNKSNFLEKGKEVLKKSFKVDSEKLKKVDVFLEQGEYALASYYDANNNNKCDLNFIGVPTEQYAFSNNFKPFMSKPNFSDCSFFIENKGKVLGIKLLN